MAKGSKRKSWALGDREMKLTVQMTRVAEGFFRAWCPALPGCVVIAETRAEAEAQIARAVEGYIASLDVALPRELGRRLQGSLNVCVA
jgi:predicted RNase H-like HicB family nuclease